METKAESRRKAPKWRRENKGKDLHLEPLSHVLDEVSGLLPVAVLLLAGQSHLVGRRLAQLVRRKVPPAHGVGRRRGARAHRGRRGRRPRRRGRGRQAGGGAGDAAGRLGPGVDPAVVGRVEQGAHLADCGAGRAFLGRSGGSEGWEGRRGRLPGERGARGRGFRGELAAYGAGFHDFFPE